MLDQDLFLERALLDLNLLTREQVQTVRRHMAEHNVDIVDAVVATEMLMGRQIALAKASICEVPFVELGDYEPCYANTALIPRNIAEQNCAFPLMMIDNVLTLAMDDPLNLEATDQIRQIVKCEVDIVLCDREKIRALIATAYTLTHTSGAGGKVVETEVDVDDDSTEPIIAAVNQMLADAVQLRASDIHINPDEHEMHLRYRIDGVLQQKQGPSLSMHASIVQRLKVMAHLDLTQTRRPQDGKFRFRHDGRNVDVRMSTVPTVCGENVVLRLLANAQNFKDFRELGMPGHMVGEFEDAIARPHGIVLVTGPTGSGKTTTLYTAMAKLNKPSRNIMTIEDPVEIRLPYLRQIQVNHEIGLTFASALRSILRQDPDVVLVGEIRDNETATIALQSALTGHLVLSTLHTNDAVGAVARLRDYGLPPFIINSAVLGVAAQRLVRRVCPHCVVPDELDDILRHRFNLEDNVEGFVRGKGCSKCGQTGYRGRVGLYEFLKFDSNIRLAIEQSASTEDIRRVTALGGMRPMWQDGLEKARMGQTTLEEVTKVASISDVEGRPEPVRKSA